VKVWNLALPLHPEARTLPMLYYIPPLLPVMASMKAHGYEIQAGDYFGSIAQARIPLRYLARLFAAGNEEVVRAALQKLIAVRVYRRQETVGDGDPVDVDQVLSGAGLTPAEAEAIFRLTAIPTVEERFVVPPYHREMAIEATGDPMARKQATGVGPRKPAVRGP
jgi:nitrate reductase beta subunit